MSEIKPGLYEYVGDLPTKGMDTVFLPKQSPALSDLYREQEGVSLPEGYLAIYYFSGDMAMCSEKYFCWSFERIEVDDDGSRVR